MTALRRWRRLGRLPCLPAPGIRSLLGHYAYRGGGLACALLVAIAAAIGGASLFDAVKPYGFQDPDSESARATEALEDASGERPLPDVVLVVDPPGAADGRGGRRRRGELAPGRRDARHPHRGRRGARRTRRAGWSSATSTRTSRTSPRSARRSRRPSRGALRHRRGRRDRAPAQRDDRGRPPPNRAVRGAALSCCSPAGLPGLVAAALPLVVGPSRSSRPCSCCGC